MIRTIILLTFGVFFSVVGISQTLNVTISSEATEKCTNQTINFNAVINYACPGDDTLQWLVDGAPVIGANDSLFPYSGNSDTAYISCVYYCSGAPGIADTSGSIMITNQYVNIDAGPDKVIGPGEVLRLEGVADNDADILWSPGETLEYADVLNTIASPEETTTYTLTVTKDGCVTTDQVIFTVQDLISRNNTITPNDDGINDEWIIGGIGNYPGAKISIFDRWGQKVWNSTGYDEPFIGRGNIGRLPAGTYFYVIDLNKGKPYVGSISLLY